MDTHVIIEVICPYCHSKLMIKKKPQVAYKTIKCPKKECGHELQIEFDVSKDPQTYRILDEVIDSEKKKGDTVYKKDVTSEGEEIRVPKDKTIYGKDKHKTPHNVFNDIDGEDMDVPKVKKRHRLRERIYLTHITWFGLRNQKFQIYEGTTTIGRYDEDDKSDIMIRGDETMSRKSVAIIIEEEDGVYDYKLKVLNATNKVKVNDQRVKEGTEVYLDFGDIIMLGNSKFKFDNH